MKIGFSLPNVGPIGTADAITKVAQRAEALGYSSLWTIERLLYPLKLQRPYPGTPDGHLPEIYKQVLDPLDALTYVAAQTKKIKLGTSVLDMPYHNPVVLARRLTTLDVLSNGRLLVGLGLGWNKDEMDATGADMTKRGALADEFLPLLKAIWTENPVEFHGKFFNVPRSYIDLKPVQKPHPPIYLGAFAPAALQRLAKLADGWNPVFLPVPVMAEMFGTIKQMAKEAGRDPSAMAMVVHADWKSPTNPWARTARYSLVRSNRSPRMSGVAPKSGPTKSSSIPRLLPEGSRSITGCLCWNKCRE